MRRFGFPQAVFTSVLLLAACGGAVPAPSSAAAAAKPAGSAAAAKPNLGELRFVYPVATITMLPAQIAADRGFDKEEGFTSTFTLATGTVGVQGLLAGQFDFTMSAGAGLAAAVQGTPVRVVAVHVAKSLFYLYAKPEIRQIKDLAGKSIGVDAIGGSQDVAVHLVLQRNGVDAKTINFVAMGGPQIPTALLANSIDAGVLAPPQDVKFRDTKYVNLGFLGDELPSLTSGLDTTAKMIEQRPDAVRAAVRAAMKGQRFFMENREGSIPFMMKFLALNEEDAKFVYDNTVKSFTQDGTVPPDVQEKMVLDQIEALKPETKPRAEDLFVLKFVNA